MAIKAISFWILVSIINVNLFASAVSFEKFKTHYRIKLDSAKENINITKFNNEVKLETLDRDTFEKLKKDFSMNRIESEYFDEIYSSEKGYPEVPLSINLKMKSNDIELFHFFRESESEFILDFWKTKKDSIKKNIVKKEVKKPVRKKKVVKKKKPVKKIVKKVVDNLDPHPGYRDFRYGASFIWNYEAMIPDYPNIINVKSKTPESLYKIKNFDVDRSKKDAHMQLTLNLYRKQKWGLMYKSIQLYEEKYTNEDQYKEINDYLQANALIRSNIDKGNNGPKKAAINILSRLVETTNNYEFRVSLLKYLIQYNYDYGNFVDNLKYAKNLYVETLENHDREYAEYAMNVIMHNLAKYGQLKDLKAFIDEKNTKKLLNKQIGVAYKIFIHNNHSVYDQSIREFEKLSKKVIGRIESSILYNVAESYLAEGEYDKAIKLFDKFIAENSYKTRNSDARLRLALAYDLSNKDINKVRKLYRDAIDRSTSPSIRYEARLRYIGLRLLRKEKINDVDKEFVSFVERRKEEANVLENKNLKHLLWQVRLRLLILEGDYVKALSYLDAIPLHAMKAAERRVFEGDGAEIIFGMLLTNYNEKKYPDVIKIWELFKDRYISKVANDPYVNFLVASAYLESGLEKGLDKHITHMEQLSDLPNRIYPIWIKRLHQTNVRNYLFELEILRRIKARKYKDALAYVRTLKDDFSKKDYYTTIINFNLKNYKDTVKSAQSSVIKKEFEEKLGPEELSKFFTAYLESHYQLNNVKDFKELADALLRDIKINQAHSLKNLEERMKYLYLETLHGENNGPSNLLIETLAGEFLEKFKKSNYKGRVTYLLAHSMKGNKKQEEAARIYRELINNEEVPGYIRELSRSELSSIELQGRNL